MMKLLGLKIGDTVKITKLPGPVRRDRAKFPETFQIFERAIGHHLTVRGIDEHGLVELWVRDNGSDNDSCTAHSIWVEPEHLVRIKP